MRWLLLAVTLLLSIVLANSSPTVLRAQESGRAGALGLVLQPLSDEDLDAILQETGYRVGVLVSRVTPGSPAAKAGMKAGDVLFTVGQTGVDSPAKVESAVSAARGTVEVLGVRQGADGQWQPLQVTIAITTAERARPAPEEAAGAQNDEIRRQLDALKSALAAGILTEEEYRTKKAALEAKLAPAAPALDPATRAKLAALEQARAAGILSDEEYARKKAELLGGRTAPGAEGPRQRVIRGQKGKTYRHVIGFTFWYPDNWKVQKHPEFLQLIPEGAATTPQGPAELYFISGESVAGEGITRASDPRVVEYLDQQVKSLSPILRKVRGPTAAPTAKGGGFCIDWEGKNPEGETILARVYVNILNESGVTLTALGLKSHIEGRTGELKSIFASFRFGKGQLDSSLVGSWSLASTASIHNDSPFETNWSNARAVAETQTTLTLRADGSWERVENYHAILLGSGVSLEDKRRDVSKGRWNAGDGVLCLMGENDTWEEYRYRLERGEQGARLRLVSGDKGEIWTR